jgi:hypothetical protein
MRTKTLLLTAAVSAVGMATSLAQVYSVNAVGYVNLTLRSDQPPVGVAPRFGTIIANPLNGTNNNLNTILPLPDAYEGSKIFRFDVLLSGYSDPIEWIPGFGWFDATNTTPSEGYPPSINPGEGFWIFPKGPSPLSVTFVGDVPQGHLVSGLPSASKFALVGSVVPQSAAIGASTTPGTLLFPAEAGDKIYIFNENTQTYIDPYEYILAAPGVPYGWFSANADDPGPDGPTIPVGTGFFIRKSAGDPLADPPYGPATKTEWVRDFSVN